MWFWFREQTQPSDAVGAYHGVITKGELSYSYPSVTFSGEWGVFYKPGTESSPELNFVYKSDAINLGIFGSTPIRTGVWYFFHWQINTTTKAASLVGYATDTAGALSMGSPGAVTGNMQEEPTFPMRIGRNTGTNGLILGENSGSFQIDNVGFSEDSGTASTLYNSGTGLACPSR